MGLCFNLHNYACIGNVYWLLRMQILHFDHFNCVVICLNYAYTVIDTVGVLCSYLEHTHSRCGINLKKKTSRSNWQFCLKDRKYYYTIVFASFQNTKHNHVCKNTSTSQCMLQSIKKYLKLINKILVQLFNFVLIRKIVLKQLTSVELKKPKQWH